MLRDRKKQHSFSTETNHTKGKRMTSKIIGLEGLILEVFKFNRIIIWKPVTATWPAASWLDSSVGRALHRYRRGHGFESRSAAVQLYGLSYIHLYSSSSTGILLSLDSSVGRALHRYRRGHGFESCGDLNFFSLQFYSCWIWELVTATISHVFIVIFILCENGMTKSYWEVRKH